MNFKDKIKELKPYDLNCNVFDVYNYNGLSMQDLLCQFFHKINECINTSNKTIDLAQWLVNEGLKEEVANKLIEWLSDGTLKNIINEFIFEELNKKVNDIAKVKFIEDYYKPSFIQGTQLGVETIPNEYNHENYEKFYDWILNPLANEFGDYVKKQTLGRDTSNLYNIYRYDFTPQEYDRTIILFSNVHGNEYTSFYGLCRFLDELCRRYTTDSNLYFLRSKVKFIVIPIANPWGFVNGKRQNINGVDLNRNTSYRWEEYTSSKGQIGGVYYKGVEPFSEKETQLIKNLIEEVKDDKIVGSIDFHTLTTIDVDKVLYYPRFAENMVNKYSNLMDIYDSENGTDKRILGSSAVPTVSNWIAHNYNINASNPEFCNKVYGTTRTPFLMRKHVEWIVNIILLIAKENRNRRNSKTEPFTKLLTWEKDTTLPDTEDDNRNSNKGHRIINSDNLNNFYMSQYYFSLDGEYILDFDGYVNVSCEKDTTLYLHPLVYQQYTPEQNYNTMNKELRFLQVIKLKAGEEKQIPIKAVLHGFHSNYNDEESSRSAEVQFRLRGRCTSTNSVWITGFCVKIKGTPSDKGKPVEILKATKEGYTTIFPTRIGEVDEDLED